MSLPNEFVIQCTARFEVDREALLKLAFGRALRISYVHDDTDLNLASFLDFKIDKWRYADAVRHLLGPSEVWLRIEFLRGRALLNAINDSLVAESRVPEDQLELYVLARLDDEEPALFDLQVLASIVIAISDCCDGVVVVNQRVFSRANLYSAKSSLQHTLDKLP